MSILYRQTATTSQNRLGDLPLDQVDLKNNCTTSYLLKKYAKLVMLVSKDGRVRFCGAELARLFQFNPLVENIDQIKNTDLLAILHQGIGYFDDGEQGSYFSKVLCEHDQTVDHYDLRFEAVSPKNDQVEWIEVEFSPGAVKGKKKRKGAEKKLREMEREICFLDAFVQGAAHDLSGSLLVFKTYVEIFNRIKNAEKRQAALDFMRTASQRMEDILCGFSDLIAYQKRKDKRIDTIDLNDVLFHVKMQLEHKIEEANPLLLVDLNVTKIRYHRAFLVSILYNLLSNALKYRKEEGPLLIDIKTEQRGRDVVLIVKDNGIGMDLQSYRHLLFEPFERFCPEREGTGIGLSFINKIIEEHGGHIKVKSVLGIGSCFEVHLRPL